MPGGAVVSEHRVARQGTGRTMRTAVVATLAGGALILGSGSAASAAPVPINIKIPNTVVVEETTANFNLAVPLKVTCDPSFGTISFNVLVNQGSVGGFRLRLVGDLHGQDRERGGTPAVELRQLLHHRKGPSDGERVRQGSRLPGVRHDQVSHRVVDSLPRRPGAAKQPTAFCAGETQ